MALTICKRCNILVSKIIKFIIKTIIFILIIIVLILFFNRNIVLTFFNKVVFGIDLHNFYCWRSFTTETLLQGKIPLWCPYTFGGYPFLASLQPAVFYPATILYLFLPINIAYNTEILVTMLLMAIFMYLWLRELSLAKVSTLIGIIIFIFSGFVAYRIYAGHINHIRALLWLPLIFYLTQKGLKAKNNYRLLIYGIICGWMVSFQISAGIPQFVIYTMLALFLFIFIAIVSSDKNFKKGIIFIAIINVLGGLLSSIQILSTLEGFKLSCINKSFDYATSFSLPPVGLLTFIFPNFFGSPLSNNYKSHLTGGYYWELQNYLSVIALLLTFVALISVLLKSKKSSRSSNYIVMMFYISIFSIIIALGKYTPIFRILYYIIPGIKGTQSPSRALGILSFSIGTLSAFGFQVVNEYLKNKRIIYFLVAFMLLGITCYDLFTFNSPFINVTSDLIPASDRRLLDKLLELKSGDDDKLWRIDAKILGNHVIPYSIENIRGVNTFRLATFENLTKILDVEKLRKLLNVKYVVSPEPHSKIYPASSMENYSNVQLVKDFQSSIGKSLKNGNISGPYEYFPEGNYEISYFLKVDNNKNRVPVAIIDVTTGGGEQILVTREIQANDFKAVDKFIPFTLILKLKEPSVLEFRTHYISQNNVNLWFEKVEVKPIPYDPERIVYRDQDASVVILRNEQFLPRILSVPFAFISNEKQIINILKNKNWDPRLVVLLERELPVEFKGIVKHTPFINSEISCEQGKIEVKRYSSDVISFSISLPSKGILLLSEIYYPGWKAEIDGKIEEIYKVNYAFRGIPIKEGRHEVRLSYVPTFWKISKRVSFFTAISSVIILICLFVKSGYLNKS